MKGRKAPFSMPEYKMNQSDVPQEESERPALRKLFFLLSPLLPAIGSFSVLLPVFETPISFNQKGECVGVGLRFLWQFLPTQNQASAWFEGILFPTLSLLSLFFSLLALSSVFLPLESKQDKRYVLCCLSGACNYALLGVFAFSFNHLILMGVSLFLALYFLLFVFLHYKKIATY